MVLDVANWSELCSYCMVHIDPLSETGLKIRSPAFTECTHLVKGKII